MKISYVEGSVSLSTPGHPKLLEHSEAQAPPFQSKNGCLQSNHREPGLLTLLFCAQL
jgi:hypothetical protein